MNGSSLLSRGVACGTAIVVGVVAIACAESAEGTTSPTQDAGNDETTTPEGGVADTGNDASPTIADCSPAGWCETALPDRGLFLLDVWPLEAHAFAVGVNGVLGVRILWWTASDAQWRYIDDGTQNEPGFGAYAGNVWAPSDDEVWFTVAPGWVYRGIRPTTPDRSTTWSWSRSPLPNRETNSQNSFSKTVNLGVWGPSRDAVFAWFNDTIFRRVQTDGGTSEWVTEYVLGDTLSEYETLVFTSAGGTGPDDMWFSGTRRVYPSECPLLVHKTAAGYRRIIDATATSDGCTPTGRPTLEEAPGGLGSLQATAHGEILALAGGQPVKIVASGVSDGEYIATVGTPLPDSLNLFDGEQLLSMWSHAGVVWLSGPGMLVRGSEIFAGGGYAISTVARNGAPIADGFYQIRGTSNDDVWAVGNDHALHKTTP